MANKSKKSIDSLKKQKVDSKKVKGGNVSLSAMNASEGALNAGSAHNVSALNNKGQLKGHLSGVPNPNKLTLGKSKFTI